MEKGMGWPAMLVAAFVGGIVVTVAVLLPTGQIELARVLGSSRAASWAQAIGTVAAIAGGGWGVYWQARQSERRILRSEIARLTALWWLAYTTRCTLQSYGETPTRAGEPLDDTKKCLEMLNRVQLIDIPDADAIECLRTMTANLDRYFRAIKYYHKQRLESFSDVRDPNPVRRTATLRNLETCERVLARLIVARGEEAPKGSMVIEGQSFEPLAPL